MNRGAYATYSEIPYCFGRRRCRLPSRPTTGCLKKTPVMRTQVSCSPGRHCGGPGAHPMIQSEIEANRATTGPALTALHLGFMCPFVSASQQTVPFLSHSPLQRTSEPKREVPEAVLQGLVCSLPGVRRRGGVNTGNHRVWPKGSRNEAHDPLHRLAHRARGDCGCAQEAVALVW